MNAVLAAHRHDLRIIWTSFTKLMLTAIDGLLNISITVDRKGHIVDQNPCCPSGEFPPDERSYGCC